MSATELHREESDHPQNPVSPSGLRRRFPLPQHEGEARESGTWPRLSIISAACSRSRDELLPADVGCEPAVPYRPWTNPDSRRSWPGVQGFAVCSSFGGCFRLCLPGWRMKSSRVASERGGSLNDFVPCVRSRRWPLVGDGRLSTHITVML